MEFKKRSTDSNRNTVKGATKRKSTFRNERTELQPRQRSPFPKDDTRTENANQDTNQDTSIVQPKVEKENSKDRTNRPLRADRTKKQTTEKAEIRPDMKAEINENVRLNKYIADCGIAARRKADEHIKNGLVTVNGNIIKEPGFRVTEGDKVTFSGNVVKPINDRVYLLLNKPKDVITSSSDEKGRRTVMDLVKDAVKERIFPVGRLDRDTTGLLLLTNDGELAEKLSHPSRKMRKLYHATLDKPLTKFHLESIAQGLTLEDGPVQVDAVNYDESGKDKKEIMIEIHVGRNRIVRRIFEHLGYEVTKLDRLYYAGLTKKDLPRGRYRYLTEREVIMLKHFS